MMAKRKRKIPNDPAECFTLAEKVAYSMRLKEIYDKTVCAWDSPPSALTAFQDKHPYNPALPWTCPSFAASYVRQQEDAARIERALEREEKRSTNRMLYRKPS
jgi:hypothetical protein